jgi:hypothetical protein
VTESGPYPAISVWNIPQIALSATLAGLQRGGRRGVEAAAFWLGTRGATAAVAAVVLPRGPGVIEGAGIWQVQPKVVGAITTWAVDNALTLLGLVHGHGGSLVTMSPTDRTHLVRAPGLLSVIVGHGGFDEDPCRWGWYLFEDGRFRELAKRERMRCIKVAVGTGCMVFEASVHGVQPVTG